METAGIIIPRATQKHCQTMVTIERSQQKLKQKLKINVASDASHEDRYVNLAVMAHNTSYHKTLKCSPSAKFHGPVPCNALNLKSGQPLQLHCGTTDIKTLVDQVNRNYEVNVGNIFGAFFECKLYCDRKTKVSPLKVCDYVFLLNPKCNRHYDKRQLQTIQRNRPFRFMKVFTQ